jgi:drug/metabolite transporter (DMT)-like permease
LPPTGRKHGRPAASSSRSSPDGYFLAAVALYGALTILWVWILTSVPLSRAYPFAVLAFVFTPVFAVLFFNEAVNVWYFVGMALILSGLAILVWKTI